MAGPQGTINLRSGEWNAFDLRFRHVLVAYFERRVHNRTEAEDLSQEVFLRLARKPDKNGGENIEAYVFRIAASVLADWGRREKTHKGKAHQPISEPQDDSSLPVILIEDRTPERVLMGKERLQDLEEALLKLKQKTRDIFLLSRVDNYSHQEIAERYGLSVSAVEKHVMKAMSQISRRVFRK